ncbi:haloacid dehalogenase, partial [candidate division WOR-3 bacterium]|nr:haloacid dehalogenase [candidate division WOR-3 bacterium]
MIKAVIFDLDNTLVDFIAMKNAAIESAVMAMIDAGLKIPKEKAKEKIYKIYDKEGIEDQKVFDKFLTKEFGNIDYRIHAAGIIGYRRAR